MPQTLLGPQQFASADEEGDDAMARAMKAGPGHAGLGPKLSVSEAQRTNGRDHLGRQCRHPALCSL